MASNEVVRAADAAQYSREPIPEEARGRIKVTLINATPDPLGTVAQLIGIYSGKVYRSLGEVPDEARQSVLADMGKTVLNGPLEAAQFSWLIEGVDRAITHQMVRSRASFFAQESLRFAVPEGDWIEEVAYPPSLSGQMEVGSEAWNARRAWDSAIATSQVHYQRLVDLQVPAEEARGLLPHAMPTRINWVCDLRTLLAEAGKRTCTQAQFPWRMIFAGMANELRSACWDSDPGGPVTRAVGRENARRMDWQFRAIADALRPVCFQTGSCGFMAAFDRSCSIRSRVDANARIGRDPKYWGSDWSGESQESGSGDPELLTIKAINAFEWAADPGAARS